MVHVLGMNEWVERHVFSGHNILYVHNSSIDHCASANIPCVNTSNTYSRTISGTRWCFDIFVVHDTNEHENTISLKHTTRYHWHHTKRWEHKLKSRYSHRHFYQPHTLTDWQLFLFDSIFLLALWVCVCTAVSRQTHTRARSPLSSFRLAKWRRARIYGPVLLWRIQLCEFLMYDYIWTMRQLVFHAIHYTLEIV